MSIYIPDKWLLISISGDNPYYQILGSWYGGYLNGDSWRLNSGVTSVKESGDYYNFHGYSGSCYKCHKDKYGINLHSLGILKEFEERYKPLVQGLYDMPDIMNMDWIISKES